MSKKSEHLRIKALLFDLGKVIFHFDFNPAFKRLAKVSSLTPDAIRNYFARSGLEVLYDGGGISSRQFYAQVRRDFKLPLDYHEFKKVWNEIFKPNPPVIRLIKKLSRDYRLVLVSNTNAMHYEHLRSKYAVLNHFDGTVLSYKQKIRKPDARIYKTAARVCRARPHEILYIDDRSDLTDAASQLGFHTFTFKNNPKALMKKIKSLRVL